MGSTWRSNFLVCDSDPYINLSAAILRQAYYDYIDRLVGRCPYRGADHDYSVESLKELEEFFNSDYCRRISCGLSDEIARRAYVQARRILQKHGPKTSKHRRTFYFETSKEAAHAKVRQH